MLVPPFVRSVLGWLRDGYPRDAPRRGYMPILALLGGELTDAQVTEIAVGVALNDVRSPQVIKDAIEMAIHHPPCEADIARVRARLGADGWPPAST